jgi:hypothetical protein
MRANSKESSGDSRKTLYKRYTVAILDLCTEFKPQPNKPGLARSFFELGSVVTDWWNRTEPTRATASIQMMTWLS